MLITFILSLEDKTGSIDLWWILSILLNLKQAQMNATVRDVLHTNKLIRTMVSVSLLSSLWIRQYVSVIMQHMFNTMLTMIAIINVSWTRLKFMIHWNERNVYYDVYYYTVDYNCLKLLQSTSPTHIYVIIVMD